MYNYIIILEAMEGPSPQRVSARHKLSKLNNSQFHELAMDVYDELVRRNIGDKLLPFLAVRPDFHPKRNQARQKLATLPMLRFTDLASDVYYELTRRYPQVTDQEDSHRPPMPPMPLLTKQLSNSTNPQPPSQATQIVPVKGMINVERGHYTDDDDDDDDDDDNEPHSPYSPKSPDESLDMLMNDLGNMVRNSPSTPQSAFNESRSLNTKLRQEYEDQIANLTKRIRQLENEKEAKNSIRIEALQEELEKWQDRYQHLEDARLEQQQVINRIKQETLPLLDELHRLSESNATLQIDKEQADTRVQEYAEELKQLETKYQNARLELRSYKASSLYTTELYQQDLSKSEFLKPTKDGIILVNNIMDYQDCIHKLLQVARSSHPSGILSVMSRLVKICRAVTSDIESAEASGQLQSASLSLSSDKQAKLGQLKVGFSVALSDLLAASRNHVNGKGISPVSLVDVAAGQVTVVVVELVKFLGIQNHNYHTNQAYNEVSTNYSPLSSPNPSRGERSLSPQELASYLKTETEHIVEAIQGLLSALRLPPHQSGQVKSIISSIVDIVTLVVVRSQSTIESAQGRPYRHRGEHVLANLTECNETLVRIRDRFFGQANQNHMSTSSSSSSPPPPTATAAAKRDLAKEAYEIAKYTKELISIFEQDD
ncbi:hypothetical protein F4703DRAFT_1737350 [Phycomyces blakesleeanus]